MTEDEALQEDRQIEEVHLSSTLPDFYVSSSSHSFVSSSQVFCILMSSFEKLSTYDRVNVVFLAVKNGQMQQIFKFFLRLISNLSRHLTGLPVWIYRRETQHQRRRQTLLQIPLRKIKPNFQGLSHFTYMMSLNGPQTCCYQQMLVCRVPGCKKRLVLMDVAKPRANSNVLLGKTALRLRRSKG